MAGEQRPPTPRILRRGGIGVEARAGLPLAERRERHSPMLAHLLENDIRK